MKNVAPIILFVYKRLQQTQQTVEHLKLNKLAAESDLFIFSEYPKTAALTNEVKKVRDYIKTIEGFKSITIVERPIFFGLAKSVIAGITSVFEKHDRVIVLEDDIVTSPSFLEFMNEGLEKYEFDNRIYSLTGYCYPPALLKIYKEYDKDVFLLPRAASWGWGTWKNRWLKADWAVKDFDEFYKNRELQKKYDLTGGDKSRMLIRQMKGEIDSWAIRWDYTHFKNNAFCVYPVKSLVNNIGLDSGTHTKNLLSHTTEIENKKPKFPEDINVDEKIIKEYKKHYKKGGNVFKVKQIISRFLGK
ncbi:MAG: sugar transferase [Bacteroidia bacterium]|nr:sugar transferase [Bacteroidia bacterium]